MRSTVQQGVAAGFVATLTVTVLMALKAMTGVAPDLDLTTMLSGARGDWAGWLAHFVVGALVLGPAFAVLAPRIPGSSCVAKAVLFSMGAWLVMQLLVLPAAGYGVFGMGYGLAAPFLTFVLNLVLGVALGTAFAAMEGEWTKKAPHDDARGALRYTHY